MSDTFGASRRVFAVTRSVPVSDIWRGTCTQKSLDEELWPTTMDVVDPDIACRELTAAGDTRAKTASDLTTFGHDGLLPVHTEIKRLYCHGYLSDFLKTLPKGLALSNRFSGRG
jgi:hypothetical protein